jgi:hypothetical protein
MPGCRMGKDGPSRKYHAMERGSSHILPGSHLTDQGKVTSISVEPRSGPIGHSDKHSVDPLPILLDRAASACREQVL